MKTRPEQTKAQYQKPTCDCCCMMNDEGFMEGSNSTDDANADDKDRKDNGGWNVFHYD